MIVRHAGFQAAAPHQHRDAIGILGKVNCRLPRRIARTGNENMLTHHGLGFGDAAAVEDARAYQRLQVGNAKPLIVRAHRQYNRAADNLRVIGEEENTLVAALPSISASASRAADGVVHVTLANLDPHAAAALTCDLRGVAGKRISGRVLTAAAMDAHNTFEQPDRVRPEPFSGAALTDGGFTLELPAKSVVVLAIG